MLKLRKVLLCNYPYYIFLLIALIIFFTKTVLIKYNSSYNINQTKIQGTLIKYNIDGDKLSFIIKGQEKVQCTYYLNTLKEKNDYQENLKLGIIIEIEGELTEPINNTIPNTFNYKKYLYNHQIYYLMSINKIVIINNQENIFYKIKNSLINKINTYRNTSNYLKTFILGDKSDLESEVYKEYQTLGVSHLFAISGMHISLFAVTIIFILKKLKIAENKRYLITIAFLSFYLFLTNFSPSVFRATLFFTFLSINKIFYTNIKTINVFLFTISALILINPFILYDLGAQYSFMTSLGLIIASEKINDKRYILNLLKVSFVALLFSLGITAMNFYELNILSLLNNLVFVPLISFIVYPLALIVLLLPFLNPVFNFVINILEVLSAFFARFNLVVLIPKANVIFWLIYYLLLTFFIKKSKIKYLILIVIMLLFNRFYHNFDNNNYIYFLDVGQGDSAVIITSYQKEVVMIDTGGKLTYIKEDWAKQDSNYHPSDNTIIFLKSIGINHLDLLLITHGDEDHAGEALNLLNNFKVNNVMLNKNDNKLEQQIRESSIIIDSYPLLKVLNYKDYGNENNNSLITYLDILNYKVLFTGDASKEQELDLLKMYNLKIDLIKLGHHGSRTSSDYNFLKSITVKKAIISAGRNNRFNHPHKETIKSLNELGINYYNTQFDGTIKVTINKKEVLFSTFSP